MMESRPDIQPDELPDAQPEAVTASFGITPEELGCLEFDFTNDDWITDCVQSDGPNAAARIIAWESEIHPKICSEARRLGQIARENGLPRVCNLGEEYQTRSGAFLKVYLEPWMQGYDGRNPNRELEEFIKVENHLATLPLSKLNDDWMM